MEGGRRIKGAGPKADTPSAHLLPWDRLELMDARALILVPIFLVSAMSDSRLSSAVAPAHAGCRSRIICDRLAGASLPSGSWLMRSPRRSSTSVA
jgi:hypothetical protein